MFLWRDNGVLCSFEFIDCLSFIPWTKIITKVNAGIFTNAGGISLFAGIVAFICIVLALFLTSVITRLLC